MTDESPETSPEPETVLRMVAAPLPNLMATLAEYSVPAGEFLNDVLKARVAEIGGDEEQAARQAVEQVKHYDHVLEWCTENPEGAARVVLCAIYLANARCMVQEQDKVSPKPAEAEAAEST